MERANVESHNPDPPAALSRALALKVSVVVPCYNKAEVVEDTLDALARQTLPADQYEVLVVDDGSTDDTEAVVRALSLPPSFRYIRQPNSGAAAARNLGVREAQGELLVFLDGDVVAAPELLEEHLASHRATSQALIMGRLLELPHQDSNVFYQVIPATAVFDHGEEEKVLPFIDGFSGNLSLTQEAFWQIGEFDEEFPRSGFEDTEFAYRAVQAGYRLMHNPRAVGYHDSFATFEQACFHLRSYQASAVLLMKKHPEVQGQIPHLRDKEPIDWREDDWRLVLRKVVRQVLALPPAIWVLKRIIAALERLYPHPPLLRSLYWKVLSSYLLLGFRDGIKRYGAPSFNRLDRKASGFQKGLVDGAS